MKKPLRQMVVFCDRWHWVLLALAAPFLLFPSPSRSLALLVVPGLWIVAWLAGHEPLPRTPLNATLLLLSLMVLVSLYATYDIAVSLPKISGIVLGLGIFYAIVREGQGPRGWWLGFLLFLGIGFGIAAVGLLGTHWVTKITLLIPIVSRLSSRITGLPGAEEGFHPNYVAGALLWVIPSFLTFSWLLLTRAKDVRSLFGRGKAGVLSLLTIGATLWSIAILILTQSRGGYLSFALISFVLIVVFCAGKSRWVFLGGVTAAVVLIVAAGWYDGINPLSPSGVSSGLASSAEVALDTIGGRLEVWSRAIYGIQDFPFTGMGMNTFRRVVHMLYPLFLISPDADIGHAHNEFLQVALDLGLPGLTAFVALYLGAFWMLGRIWQRARATAHLAPSDRRAAVSLAKPGDWFSVVGTSPLADARLVQIVVLGLGGGLLAHLVWGVTDAMALGARPAFLFWVILGLISGLHQQVQDNWVAIDSSVPTTRSQNGVRE